MFSRLLITTAIVAGLATSASAATVTYSQTLANQATDFSNIAVGGIQKFNTSLGTLNSATISLLGTVAGEMAYENRSNKKSTINLSLSAIVALSTAALNDLVVALPTIVQSNAAAKFDGTVDFGGTSGATITGLSSSNTAISTLTGADLAEFIGAGLVGLTMSGDALSSITGSGSLISFFDTYAGGSVTVTYDYTVAPPPPPPPPSPVPLPAGLPLSLLGLAALGTVARLRKS